MAPHIVSVHDRGEHNGQLWISMDYVDGLDAAHLLASRYPAGMPVDQVVRIVTAVASALDYAHKKGLLHRDVKPANIMLSHLDDEDEQRILLADFGIARNIADISGLTTTNMTVGTVAYSAPEQLMDGQQRVLAPAVRRLVETVPGFPTVTPHDLRHTAASLAISGVGCSRRRPPCCSQTRARIYCGLRADRLRRIDLGEAPGLHQ